MSFDQGVMIPGYSTGLDRFIALAQQLAAPNNLLLWPLNEIGPIAYDVGGNKVNGNYNFVTQGTAGWVGGRGSVTVDAVQNSGNGGYVDWIGSSLNTYYQLGLSAGTLFCAAQITAWGSQTLSQRLITIFCNNNNFIHMRADNAGNKLGFGYTGATVSNEILANTSAAGIVGYRSNFVMWCMTYDVNDKNHAYCNGIEVAESPSAAAPTAMTGNLDLTNSQIGNRRTNSGGGIWAPMLGPLEFAGFIPGKALTAAQVAKLSVPA